MHTLRANYTCSCFTATYFGHAPVRTRPRIKGHRTLDRTRMADYGSPHAATVPKGLALTGVQTRGSSMYQRLAAIGAAVAVALSMGVFAPSSAFAAESDCAANQACFWRDASFSGGGKFLTASNPNLIDFSDVMTSWKNSYTARDAGWYWDANYQGALNCMKHGVKNANVGYHDNDELSSVKIFSSTGVCP